MFYIILMGGVSFIQKESSTNKWRKNIIEKTNLRKILSKLMPLYIKEITPRQKLHFKICASGSGLFQGL